MNDAFVEPTRALTTHVGSPDFALIDDLEYRATNVVCVVVQAAKGQKNGETQTWKASPKVPQHHGGAENHGSRVSLVSTHDITSDVTASRLKQGVILQEVNWE